MKKIKKLGLRLSLVAKLFKIYFGFSLADRLHEIKKVLNYDKLLMMHFFDDKYTNLLLYYNNLLEFKKIWYLGIPDDMEPWDWLLLFAEDPMTYMGPILECCPKYDRILFKGRIKLKENSYNNLIKIKDDWMEKTKELNISDYENDFIDSEFIDMKNLF